MNKTARATLATKKAAVVNKFIKVSCMSLAEVALEDYYWHFGDTKGYRHLYREVTMALYNAKKEVK